jgi:hypothetical protein
MTDKFDRERAEADLDQLHERLETYEDALISIEVWSTAYPLGIFPEPDLRLAADLLLAGGITLDAVSASCMRHVISGVGAIARRALAEGGKKA